MKWSENAENTIRPVYHKIMCHPFIYAVMDGTLEHDKFIFYLSQDALYLAEFSKVLAGISAKLSNPDHVDAFLTFAKDAIAVEKALHNTFLKDVKHDFSSTQSPTCLLYTSYLHHQQAKAPINVAAAAVLPCFWIYKKVGDYMKTSQQKILNPYQAWIDTYSGDEYANAVTQALAICDELAEQSTPEQQDAMTSAFVTATKLEWMFWHSAWRLEEWPV